ncbi:MAG: hypothetical protein JO140_01890 [Candidatus Eremiobacteraeota bacterium]|nr:hypothetical protein [Candidatus Eremiobacteraeota bacterium]
MRFLLAGVALLVGATAASAAESAFELEQLQSAWAKVNDYQVTIVARESSGKTEQERRFHYSFLRPEHAKAEMLDGPLKGVIAVWNGGDRVITYHHGFLSKVRIGFNIHDKFVTSLRGNGISSGDLGIALKCYQSRLEDVRQAEGPTIDGSETVELILDGKGTPLHCPGDAPADDQQITKDAIFVGRASHFPLRRIRYAGDAQVEQWDLLDLRINTGLSAQDFS